MSRIRPVPAQIFLAIPSDHGEHFGIAITKEWVANGDESFFARDSSAVQSQGAFPNLSDLFGVNDGNKGSLFRSSLIKVVVYATGIIPIKGPVSEKPKTFARGAALRRLQVRANNGMVVQADKQDDE